MPKRKLKEPEVIDDLVSELRNSEDDIKTKLDEVLVIEEKHGDKTETDKKRAELVRLAEDGKISQSAKYVRKAIAKIINKIYSEYEVRWDNKAYAFLTDIIISRFAGLLGGIDAVESSDELDKELQRDKLLKNDVESVVRRIMPLLPFLGFLSGGVTVVNTSLITKAKR